MRKLFSLIAAVLFAGSMMAADPIVINAADVTGIESGATTGLDVTLQGVQIVWEGAYYNTDDSKDFRVYAGKALTLTAAEKISKVEIAGLAKKDLAPSASAGTITTGASFASETTKKTLDDPLIVIDEINAKSLTLTCNKQMRAYIIRLTLAEGGDDPEPVVEVVVYNWSKTEAEQVGTTILGAGGKVTVSTVKIHENADQVDAIKFEKSFVYADGHYAAIKPAEGKFLAGDTVKFAGAFSNDATDGSKFAQADFYAADGATALFRGDSVVNGKKSADDPKEEYFVLEADQDSILLGRYGNTNLFITLLKVVRAADEPEPEDTWTVAGSSAIAFGTTWDPENANNDMAKQEDGSFKWEETELELAAGEIAFKVCKNHAWAEAYPAQDYKLAISEAGIYTITITFNPESKEVAADATKTGEAVVLPTVVLHGNFTGSWADTKAFTPAEDKLTATLTLALAEGTFEFGFKFDGTWKANGANITREENTAILATGDGNMHITADVAGDYLFTYTFETQKLEVTYPAAPAEKITCAEVYSLSKGDAAALNDVVVTFANGKNVWVKDETASMLIYLSANTTWQAGDVLSGVEGTVDIYNGVTEVKPSADQAAAVTATPGEAPAPEAVETVTTDDVNKYIVLKGVEAEGAFEEGKQSNITIAGVTVRNQFKNGYTFEAGKKYDIEGVVTIYSNNPQVYFITASESSEQGIEETLAEGKAVKVVREGALLIMKGDKTYTVMGQIVK